MDHETRVDHRDRDAARRRGYKLETPNKQDRAKVETLLRACGEDIDPDDAYLMLQGVRLAFTSTNENKYIYNELNPAISNLDIEVARQIIALSQKERRRCMDDDKYVNRVVKEELQLLQDKFKYGYDGQEDTPGAAQASGQGQTRPPSLRTRPDQPKKAPPAGAPREGRPTRLWSTTKQKGRRSTPRPPSAPAALRAATCGGASQRAGRSWSSRRRGWVWE